MYIIIYRVFYLLPIPEHYYNTLYIVCRYTAYTTIILSSSYLNPTRIPYLQLLHTIILILQLYTTMM